MKINLNEINNNYHKIIINNFEYEIINQLNKNKNISNFYLPKKLIKKIPNNELSYKIKIYDKFISVPKKMCFLDKTKKYYLIGINLFFNYWVYNISNNKKINFKGYKLIEKTEIKKIHFYSIKERSFIKEKNNNLFLKKYENYEQAKKDILNNKEKWFNKYKNIQNYNNDNNIINKNNSFKKNKIKIKYNNNYKNKKKIKYNLNNKKII